ncbi:MAG TPA: DNA polymerase III subunit gamma/tau [Patescibacteria group bacterium]|nr:DNA polymerase III subunit gamma/tau [Patescibacteria group bacterium]
MFYLTYRPQKLSEIDNKEVREKLTHVLAYGVVPHALLFTGPKGTGKTSCARLIAKVVNCEQTLFSKKKGSIEPCNTCSFCVAITKGSHPDVVEIDAASNRKIDDVRDLISRVKFAPLYTRHKVYIIDEVHMLTHESFNALLKTLEEPPPSTIFILATTEAESLPKTVISRCIRFHFHKAKEKEIIGMLSRIAAREHIEVKGPVFEMIARHADHSFRDGAKLFEEMVYTLKKTEKTDKKVTLETAKKIIGLTDEIQGFMKFLEKKDVHATVSFIEHFDSRGGSCKVLIESALDELHAQLLKKNKIEMEDVHEYALTLKDITRLIKLFQEAYSTMRYSPIESLPLEVAVVEYIHGV